MLDITNEPALRQYLADKKLTIQPNQALLQRLGGGVSCDVIRIDAPEGSFVIKKALPQLRVKEDWFSDISRIVNEKDCLAFYNQQAPDCTPKLLFYDEEEYLFGMEAAPAGAEMWKRQLLEGNIDFSVARKVAETLAAVHNAAAKDLAVKTRFADQKFFVELRIDPYLGKIAERHPQLSNLIKYECDRLLASQITLVHGDYSPKNILVDNGNVYILDYEVAHYGDPSFDLGFLTNHFILKAVKNQAWALAYLNLALYTAETYLKKIDFTDPVQLEADTVRTLALLFLARVDGKSPAEYITAEHDQALIRRLSYTMLTDKLKTYQEVADLFNQQLKLR